MRRVDLLYDGLKKENPIDFFFLTETYNKLYESETSTK